MLSAAAAAAISADSADVIRTVEHGEQLAAAQPKLDNNIFHCFVGESQNYDPHTMVLDSEILGE